MQPCSTRDVVGNGEYQLASAEFSYTNFKSVNRRTSQNKWISSTYFIKIEKTDSIKSKY